MGRQMSRVWLWVWCLTAAMVLATAGCRPEEPNAAGEVTVEVADRAAYDELLASLRGNVVLVDFWATWCRPCVASFPQTVQLSRRYADRPVRVVSVSLDDPDDRGEVLEFLQTEGAKFLNLISAYGGSPESVTQFEISSGAIPHYKLYDKAGELRHQFEGHSEEIEQRVEELLGQT